MLAPFRQMIAEDLELTVMLELAVARVVNIQLSEDDYKVSACSLCQSQSAVRVALS
jgi:hypothetical protein